MREGKFFVHAADVDDFSASFCGAVMFHKSLCDEKKSLEIYVQNKIEIFFPDVPEFRAFFDARVVDENVDAAKLFFRFRDEAFAVGNFGNVALNGDGVSATRFQLIDDFLRACLVGKIADGNGGTVRDKTLGDAESDALIPAGNGGDFACETSGHVEVSVRGRVRNRWYDSF